MLVAGMVGCGSGTGRVEVDRGQVIVHNDTSSDWSDVEVWLNDHYRAMVPEIVSDGRFEVPLDVFVAGFGQRFDRGTQGVTGLEVTASASDGTEVRLVWGTGRRTLVPRR